MRGRAARVHGRARAVRPSGRRRRRRAERAQCEQASVQIQIRRDETIWVAILFANERPLSPTAPRRAGRRGLETLPRAGAPSRAGASALDAGGAHRTARVYRKPAALGCTFPPSIDPGASMPKRAFIRRNLRHKGAAGIVGAHPVAARETQDKRLRPPALTIPAVLFARRMGKTRLKVAVSQCGFACARRAPAARGWSARLDPRPGVHRGPARGCGLRCDRGGVGTGARPRGEDGAAERRRRRGGGSPWGRRGVVDATRHRQAARGGRRDSASAGGEETAASASAHRRPRSGFAGARVREIGARIIRL